MALIPNIMLQHCNHFLQRTDTFLAVSHKHCWSCGDDLGNPNMPNVMNRKSRNHKCNVKRAGNGKLLFLALWSRIITFVIERMSRDSHAVNQIEVQFFDYLLNLLGKGLVDEFQRIMMSTTTKLQLMNHAFLAVTSVDKVRMSRRHGLHFELVSKVDLTMSIDSGSLSYPVLVATGEDLVSFASSCLSDTTYSVIMDNLSEVASRQPRYTRCQHYGEMIGHKNISQELNLRAKSMQYVMIPNGMIFDSLSCYHMFTFFKFIGYADLNCLFWLACAAMSKVHSFGFTRDIATIRIQGPEDVVSIFDKDVWDSIIADVWRESVDDMPSPVEWLNLENIFELSSVKFARDVTFDFPVYGRYLNPDVSIFVHPDKIMEIMGAKRNLIFTEFPFKRLNFCLVEVVDAKMGDVRLHRFLRHGSEFSDFPSDFRDQHWPDDVTLPGGVRIHNLHDFPKYVHQSDKAGSYTTIAEYHTKGSRRQAKIW